MFVSNVHPKIYVLVQGIIVAMVLFLDVENAFDKVEHNGLLFKLKKILSTSIYLVLKSYLRNKHFYVKVKNDRSNIHKIEGGIPQGRVLSLILYARYSDR